MSTTDESNYWALPPPSAFANATYTEALDRRTFEPNKQTRRLFREQALRLVFTALLVAGTVVALRLYEQQDTVAHSQKISFNVVITILNLALGLNFLVGIMLVLISKVALIKKVQ